MQYEQLCKCSDQLFQLKLLEVGLSIKNKNDECGGSLFGSYLVDIPLASDYFVIDPCGQLAKIFETKLFRRQEGISQLQFLIHEDKLNSAELSPRLFQHQRSEHARLATCLGVAILLQHSVAIEEVLRFAVTAAYHDCATPAGGDTVIRLNRKELCEEKNFSSVMHGAGMDRVFVDFAFEIKEAQAFICGHGMYGQLLDFVDKLSYTLLDVHYSIKMNALTTGIAGCVSKNAFFGNVWKDVALLKSTLSFLSARRLHNFLLIRALMHDGLYRNPAWRKLEVVYTKAIQNDLKRGVVTCEQLMRNDDRLLETTYDYSSMVKKAKKIGYRSFKESCRALRFIKLVGDRLVYMEEMTPFKTGLSWLVKRGDIFRPLHDNLHHGQSANLEQLARHRQGWHLYFI